MYALFFFYKTPTKSTLFKKVRKHKYDSRVVVTILITNADNACRCSALSHPSEMLFYTAFNIRDQIEKETRALVMILLFVVLAGYIPDKLRINIHL